MLSVQNVTKSYGAANAISHVTFQASEHQIVGLIGHNGSGKSTTMNIITGYLSATEGNIRVGDADVAENPLKAKENIGFMPENPPLYFDMTVEEQLQFTCALRKIPRSNRKSAIHEACVLADVDGVRQRLIRNLSKGYRQRIGLAQALIGNPPLLILDEPTAGLDPRQIIEVRETILRLGEDHTILLSSHILSEISAVCDRLVILSNGKVVADDTEAVLLRKHAGPQTYELRVADHPETILPLLEKTDWAQNPRVCRGDGAEKLMFASDESGIFNRIYPILQTADSQLVSFVPVQPSLEEVFLSLTQDLRYQQ